MNTFTIFTKFFSILKRKQMLFLMLMLGTLNSIGQVTVAGNTNTTPALGTTYTTLANAITALNGTSAISGPVVITLTGNETAPAGGYSITAIPTGASATNNITIQGSSSTITSFAPQVTGNLNDAIFKLIGVDFVTIQNFAMQENAANIVPTAASNNMTEWGIALLYASTTNGAQNNTIQNCTISLNRIYQNSFGIYSNSTHSATAPTTSLTATTTAGGNTGLKIYGNTISNVNQGIIVVGPTAIADANSGIDIGGTGGSQANTISNFGTTGTFSGYANVSGSVNGILVRNSNGFNISYNTITSSVGGVTSGTLNGIQIPAASNAPSTTFTNTINNNALSLQSAVATGAINGINYPAGSASATSVLNVNSNNFLNSGHTVVASGAITFISLLSTHLTTTINSNTFTNLNVNTAGNVTFISNNITVPSSGSRTVNNNSIVTAFNKTGAGGTVTFLNSNSSSTASVTETNTGNDFSNVTLTGATTLNGWLSSDGTGTSPFGPSKTVSNNTFTNIVGGTGAMTILTVAFSNLGTTNIVSGNTISNISGAGSIVGITSSTGSQTFRGNIITGLSSSGASSVSGITITGASATETIEKNTICDISGSNASSTVNGILISNAATVTISNNRIGDLRTPAANAAHPLIGINITGGTTVNAYFNTVRLSASSTGALFGSSAISASSSTNLTLNDNIFVNTSTPVAATGFTTAYRRSGLLTSTNYISSSNNNLFYAGTPGANNLIHYDGTNSFQTLASYKAMTSPITLAPRDASSVTENPTFLSTTCGNANFLKINTTIATQIESGGGAIAGITDDFEGDIRNVSTPDLGADEFTGIAADITPPSISYTALGNACAGSFRTLTATITDASGITNYGTVTPNYNTFSICGNGIVELGEQADDGNLFSGDGISSTCQLEPGIYNRKSPILYYNVNNGIYMPIVSNYLGANSYSWAIPAYSTGDVIKYYLAAQDNATTPNVSVSPSSGAAGLTANPPAASTPPTSPSTFNVLATLNGTYLVGAGQVAPNYATLSAAISDYNNKCLSGNVVFSLTDASYTTTSDTIKVNSNAGPSNTLTIKPTLANTTITGNSSAAVLVLQGADYVTIDGSIGNTINSCCPASSASRDLTITNANTGTSSAVIWLLTNGGDGATNNTIKNCNLVGSSNTQTLFGVGSGASSISTGSLGTGNNNNAYINNNISKVQIGIYSQGASAANKNTSTTINQNLMNAVSPNHIALGGILLGFENNTQINCNTISEINGSADRYAINLGIGTSFSASTPTGNEVTNATVSKNVIGNIIGNGTNTAVGIIVASATSGTTTIANNMISGVISNSTPGDYAAGISIGGGTGSVTNIYYNTVSMQGTMPSGSAGTATSTCLALTNTTLPTVDIRNNIFSNTQVGSASSTTKFSCIAMANSTFATMTSNNNDLYCAGVGPGTYQIGITGTVNSGTSSTTLANWQTTSGKDASSVNTLPIFISSSNLHLVPVSNSSLNDLGTVVSVTDDIDCANRSATPDMGADEFTPPNCTLSSAPVANGNASFCNSGSATITATGYTASAGMGSSYQWYSSSNASDYPATGTAISGQTNPASVSTGTLTTTTYYWLKVRCAVIPDSAYSNMITITVNPSAVAISPSSVTICAGESTTLTETGGTATSWLWANNSATNSAITVSPASTTTYTVTATGAGPCSLTATRIVTVNPSPSVVSASASPASLCEGANLSLTSIGSGGVSPVTNYSFATSSGTYTPITGGTVLASGAWDDSGPGIGIPLGFNFNFDGTTYTTCNINLNGFISFGSSTGASIYAPLSDLITGDVGTISAFGRDLQGVTSTGEIRYLSSGGVFTVQWTNARRYNGSATNAESFNFQIQLNQTTNEVKLVYGTFSNAVSAGDASQAQVGIRGTTTSLFTNLEVLSTGNWSTPTLGTTNILATAYYNQATTSVKPSSGLTYSFKPSLTYAWSGPNAYSSSSQNPTISTIPLANSGTYTVTVTSSNGCTATSSTSAVTVNPLPTATPSTNPICIGGSATISVALTGSAPWTYDVFDGTTTVNHFATSSPDVFNVSPGSTTTYTVTTILDNNNCLATGTNSTTVTVNPLPTVTVIGAASSCAGSSSNLSIAFTGTAPWTYSLNGAASVTTSNNPEIISINPTITTPYTVTSISDANCAGIASNTYTLTVNPLPTASISGTTTICNGDAAVLTVNLTGAGPWSFTMYKIVAGNVVGLFNTSSTTSSYTVSFSPTSTASYQLGNLLDANCSGSVSGSADITVNQPTITSTSHVDCDTYTWPVNSATYTNSGNYVYTYLNANNCLSSDTLHLTINHSTSDTIAITACDSYVWASPLGNGTTYTSGGTFTHTSMNASNCIHTQTLILTINASTSGTTTATACDTYTWSAPLGDGTAYTSGGTYTHTSLNATNCVHTQTLILTINASTSGTTTATACDTYTWTAPLGDGASYTSSGTYTHTSMNANNCVHTQTLVLTINASTSGTSTETTCNSYTWSAPLGDGANYTTSGTYTHTSMNANNCVHTQTLVLTINASTSGTTTATACDTYTWLAPLGDGATYTSGGTFTHTSLDGNNCVHTQTLVLTINASTSGTTTATACDSYTWAAPLGDGASYTSSGTYSHTSMNSNNCVHTQTLVLTINASTSGATTTTACDNYTWLAPLGNGTTYTTSGTYTHTSMNANNCVHTQTLVLTINASTNGTTTATACDTYTWLAPLGDGATYTCGGTFTHTSLNANNCLHTQTLTLTVNVSSSGTTAATACNSYTWAAPLGDGATYTIGGTYTHTSLNASNCVHSQTLVLTINASTNGTTTASVCDSYTWAAPLGDGSTYTLSGTYTHTSLNAANCVHTQTLVLIVTPSSSHTSAVAACDSYAWGVNGTTYTTSGTYSFVSGCHTEILNLTITSSTSNTTTASVCDSYLWSLNGVTYTATGVYSIVTGCHTEYLNVTITPSTTTNSTIVSCGTYLWPANGVTYTTSGSYTYVNGCATYHLNLTINATTVFNQTVNTLACYTWPVNGASFNNTGVYTYTTNNSTTGCLETYNLNLTVTAGVKLKAKVLLAGPYDAATGLMYDSLRVRNLLPSTEPYSTSPYSKLFTANETASETVSGSVLGVSGNDAIVDWVYLELRNSTTPSTIMFTKRALVQRDGDIVSSDDGVSPVFFKNVAPGSYYVSVKHRNHLGVMSAAPVTFDACTNALINFITDPVYVASGISTSPRKLISAGVNALWSADCNNNKNVKYNGLSNDKDVILNAVGVGTPNNIVPNVYRMEDANLDGKIRFNNADNDRLYIINNVGVNTPNNILFQHTPN